MESDCAVSTIGNGSVAWRSARDRVDRIQRRAIRIGAVAVTAVVLPERRSLPAADAMA
jgi:hypothetical protein